MDRSLWLLMRLQLWGWLRFLGRSLRTVKGAALAVLGVAVFAPWLLTALVTPPPENPVGPDTLRRFGPVVLLAVTLISALFTFSTQRAISFSPAELNFLFSGPFSRRQLLAYKVAITLGGSALATPLVALALRHYAARVLSAWVGLLLALMFLQLFAIALALLASVMGASAYNRWRQAVLLGLVAAAVVAVLWAGWEALFLGPRQVLEQVEQSPLWGILLTPFRWFVEAFLAEQLVPGLLLAAGRALAINLVLLLLIFALDARYLEAAAASSEKVYAQLERLRQGGMLSVRLGGSGRARFSLPSLPWLGGVGPTLWRQLLTMTRAYFPLLVLLGFYAMTVVPFLAATNRSPNPLAGTLILTSTLAGMTLFLTTMIAYDFRADIDRIELLKTLPLTPARLVLGQLAAPVLLVSILQLVVLVVAQAVLGRVEVWLLPAVVAFALPFNFLVFGIENLLFLWFPTRLIPTTPGDFQLMGRHMLLMLAKVLAFTVALAPAATLAVMALVIAAVLRLSPVLSRLAVLAAAWLGLTAVALALVPVIALAFRRFDVTRDTPP